MDTMAGYALAQAAIARGEPGKVFDWNKAAEIIKERKPTRASAGLSGDWEYTGGDIFVDGKPLEKDKTYTYLASVWATPELELVNQYGDVEKIDCWILRNADNNPENWNANTFWPDSALAILNKE